jgi:hypothetical protein
MANSSFSPLLCRAYSIDSSSDQESTNSFHSSQQTTPQFSLQSQLNDFDLEESNNNGYLSSDENTLNEQQHPLDTNSVDSINLQMNTFDLVNTPVSMSMSI